MSENKEASKPKEKIYLKSVKVIFANLEDEGFGRSITVDVTDEALQKQVTEWVKTNNIGKKDPGVATFKEYEGVKQYALRINDNTKFVYTNGLSDKDLGYGAVVSLAANAFDYDNKFGKGTSSSLSAVVVEKGRSSGADDDIAELLGDDITKGGEPVDLSEIPF